MSSVLDRLNIVWFMTKIFWILWHDTTKSVFLCIGWIPCLASTYSWKPHNVLRQLDLICLFAKIANLQFLYRLTGEIISPIVHISSSLQLRSINLHGDTDRVWNEVSGDVEHGSPGPGIAELSGGKRLHHQDFRLRDESQPVQLGLLSDRGQSHPPHQVDGLGERSIGEISFSVNNFGLIHTKEPAFPK